MRRLGKKYLLIGILMVILFVCWTLLIQIIDVQSIGQNGTDVGFATLNTWFHQLTGVNMFIFTITDWLGLVPILICIVFAMIGFTQMIKRKSILKVDLDIILLGIYYFIVIIGYLLFEIIPINYRPILIDGRLEASYPSSTTLLVLCVMPTLMLQIKRRVKNIRLVKIINPLIIVFTSFMVIGRLLSGVHWLTDIIGAILLSIGLFCLYYGVVILYCKEER
ncbi:MAG: phosphatase PAP2 family protein [Erysipelotrichales bacterium]|nr:phosphatase PAP2 family protein [Erysipelotrichales bacterium]